MMQHTDQFLAMEWSTYYIHSVFKNDHPQTRSSTRGPTEELWPLEDHTPSLRTTLKRPLTTTTLKKRPLSKVTTLKTHHSTDHPQETSLNRPPSRHITQPTTLKTHHSTDHPQDTSLNCINWPPSRLSILKKDYSPLRKISHIKRDCSQDRSAQERSFSGQTTLKKDHPPERSLSGKSNLKRHLTQGHKAPL